MEPHEIRAALILKKISVTSIAQKLKTALPNVSAVISGDKHTPRTREAIAAAIGKPVDDVFPVTKESE